MINPFKKRKPGRKSKASPQVKLDLISMDSELTARIWILKTKTPTPFLGYYSARAYSFVAWLDGATFFASEANARLTLDELEVGVAQQLAPVNLHEHLMELVSPEATGAKDWDDMGIESPDQ